MRDNMGLYRGKRVDDLKRDWVIGHYVSVPRHMIVLAETMLNGNWHFFDIDPDTVGQFTGLVDKNGVKVFEGDIVSYNKSREVVVWSDEIYPCFCLGCGGGSSTPCHPYKITKRHVVIGNIHNNPELLEAAP